VRLYHEDALVFEKDYLYELSEERPLGQLGLS